MKIKNYNSFFKLTLWLSGGIQLNPEPTPDVLMYVSFTKGH